ncbi:MAG TPA: TonB-dependent receptor [Flavitalea sp.]|nr:TonB-dependent receptor [Flavitalea sp.]
MLTKLLSIVLLLTSTITYSQTIVKGKIVDAVTNEPLSGASIKCADLACHKTCTANQAGYFEMPCPDCKKIEVSYIGYASQVLSAEQNQSVISLQPSQSLLQGVVVTANREVAKRSEAPIAITSLTAKTIQDAKPTSIDQVLNKVSGVYMVNLGNEQHQMSIRQPMTTKSLFLYLEDGIPVRTSGLFNHNALLELNMATVKNIEVIKGPSSSLYGSEAIGGVVNFITQAPTAIPTLKLSVQGNDIGYKRTDLQTSMSSGRWGVVISGYYADKKNNYMEFSDFHKGTLTARIDYRFSDKTNLSNSVTWVNYYSDMPGGIDSTMFANKVFRNPQTFTYRKVDALRYHSTLTQSWSDNSKTSVSVIYRSNTIEQNPAYRIKDDYRKQGSAWIGNKALAHGEINDNRFHSYAMIAQHKQKLNWKKAVIIGGINIDVSPSTYNANYIRIKKDTIANKYVSYQSMDSTLTDYSTRINNYAGFLNIEFSPVEKLRVVASLRYDQFHYGFNNHLSAGSFSGSSDTVNRFARVSSKIGFTYNFSSRTGIYANYSEGFVPPQVTEMYTGVKVPHLDPSVVYNYELGGWMEIVKNKLSADISLYKLNSTDEIISVRQDDGSTANENAGKTLHKGIELAITATPTKTVSLRLSGAYSKHQFVEYVEKGTSYNGNDMNGAPNWMYNAEIWYKPAIVKGLRMGAELQFVGSYFVDPKNTAEYSGYTVLNLRAGYQVKGLEIWVNALNALDNYYANIVSKSSFGYSYTLAEPRNINIGLSYNFNNLFKGH